MSARQPVDRGFEITSLREALRKVAIAGVTVNTDTREPNEVYHLLNRELKPLCGAGEVDGRFVTAVTAPWILRCKRIGCAPHWRYIKEPNEVITTKTGNRFHRDVDCSAFKAGHRSTPHASGHHHDVVQMSLYEAEKAGKTACLSCSHG
ncbi:hypothetical protein [Nonomuraea sp. NPDC050786]|uniref:hypothetical protein n=1 Tax=Nonomuraea sp. NPDC050786 TaxID=3154840 RepID=UPI0033E810EC